MNNDILIDIAEALTTYAQNGRSKAVTELLIVLNGEDTPERDQSVIDLYSDFYVFLVYGYDPRTYPDGIRNWEDLKQRIQSLKRSSQPS